MQSISREELLKKLNMHIKKSIQLQIEEDSGIDINIVLKEFLYCLEEDIIKFKDILNKNIIAFNLNNVNFIGIDNEKISCILNDQKDTIIKISEKRFE